MPSPWGHSMSLVSLSSAAELMGFVFTPLAPGQEHREDPCLEEIFLGGISEILDKDVTGDIGTNLYLRTVPHLLWMLRHPTSVETPVIGRILERRDILAGSFASYFFPFHLSHRVNNGATDSARKEQGWVSSAHRSSLSSAREQETGWLLFLP